MKNMNLSYDHSCQHGRCAGYGTPSMVAVTAQSFFRPLLQTNTDDAPAGPGPGAAGAAGAGAAGGGGGGGGSARY